MDWFTLFLIGKWNYGDLEIPHPKIVLLQSSESAGNSPRVCSNPELWRFKKAFLLDADSLNISLPIQKSCMVLQVLYGLGRHFSDVNKWAITISSHPGLPGMPDEIQHDYAPMLEGDCQLEWVDSSLKSHGGIRQDILCSHVRRVCFKFICVFVFPWCPGHISGVEIASAPSNMW